MLSSRVTMLLPKAYRGRRVTGQRGLFTFRELQYNFSPPLFLNSPLLSSVLRLFQHEIQQTKTRYTIAEATSICWLTSNLGFSIRSYN